MTSQLNFIKIYQLVQKLLGGHTDRRTGRHIGDLISLTFLFEESRLIIKFFWISAPKSRITLSSSSLPSKLQISNNNINNNSMLLLCDKVKHFLYIPPVLVVWQHTTSQTRALATANAEYYQPPARN
jgi:hypothetical protein